jgi:hypothetical protein
VATRDELKPDQVWKDYEGDILRTNRSVPGDGSAWYCDIWSDYGKCWLAEDHTVEPSDLIERVADPELAA